MFSKVQSKIATFALLAAFAISAVSASAQIVYPSPCQPMPPACHEHSHPLPAQKTGSHECCVASRAPALPVHFARIDPFCRPIAIVRIQPAFAADSRERMGVRPYRSEAPPDLSPLRI